MPTLRPQQPSDLQAAESDQRDRTTAVPSLHSIQQRDLPEQLQSVLPSCAQQCLQTYITQEYASSCSGEAFDCLCSQYSSQGYTVGELAYICLQGSCSSNDIQQKEAAYGVCSSQTSAVPPTHSSTLTVPATSATDIPSSTENPATATAMVTPTSPISIAAASGTTTPSQASSTSSQASAAALAAGSFTKSTTLSVGQAVGISIAAFAGVAIIIAIIYCIMRSRRKRPTEAHKPKKSNSYDFVDNASPRFTPVGYTQAGSSDPLGIHVDRSTKSPEKQNKARTRLPVIPSDPDAADLLVGRDRPLVLDAQRSSESMRTLSRLLPDKPGQTPPQRPHTQWPQAPILKSPATIFEEDTYSRIPLQPAAPTPRAPSKALMSPEKQIHPAPPARAYADQYTKCPEEIGRPSLSLHVPQRARSTNRIPPADVYLPPLPQPPPPKSTVARGVPALERREIRVSRAKSGTSTVASDVLNYYASAEAGSYTTRTDLSMPSAGPPTSNPLGSPLTPISLEPQQRIRPPPAVITLTRPTMPPRVVKQRPYSTGSNTSFESTDPDEPTPPEEDKQLSPVTEHSPIAAIRYPKIPRSSNQAVPRSPTAQPSSRRAPPRHERRLSPRAVTSQSFSGHLPPTGRSDLPSQLQTDRRPRGGDPRTPESRGPEDSTLSGSTLASRRRGSNPGYERRLVIDTSHCKANSKSSGIRPPPRIQDVCDVEPLSGQSKGSGSLSHSPLKGDGRPPRTPRNTPATATIDHTAFRSLTNGLLTPEMTDSGPKVLRYANIDVGHRSDGSERIDVTQQVVLQSALWEPKLTPRRKGDDLYLDVGMASPQRWDCATSKESASMVGHAF